MKDDCPAPDLLAAFVSGELPTESKAAVESHVSHCDVCLETIGYLTSKASQPEAESVAHRTLAEAEQMIGPYRLIRRVGEGGMGEVWETQQLAPVRRTVALKLLKAGMDTRQIVTRFQAERQMLALMQHPSIAQVFDAGISEAGRPYFVMEYVDGVRITEFCDQQNLSVQARLTLFKQVCEAVQHAHQKGVIHRDLKPSNVLVTAHADKALPKVIDFGLAKATTSELADASLTEMGTMLGTPAYASPEQLSLGALDIDTRSDVYSLGALLYELLVGVIPFEAESAQPLAMMELRRAIREREPTRPSARLSRLGERLSIVARARGLEARALRKQLRGDLDWIVMRALEKDRDRRYASPHELSLDIDRYLNHEPLQARPPSSAYRLRKFVRRHRLGTAFAATLASLVIVFVIVTIVQAQRVAKERDRATAEAAKANSINAFLQETLGSADPWQTGKDISIREVLSNAAAKADAEFEDQPLIAAAVKNSIGRAYVELGQLDAGEQLIRAALEARKTHAAEPSDVAESLRDLAVLLRHRGRFADSETHVREALTLQRKTLGARDGEVAESLVLLALVLYMQGEFAASERAALEALAIREERFGAQSIEAGESLLMLSSIRANARSDFAGARDLAQRGYDIYARAYGETDLRTANAANTVGVAHWLSQQYDKAFEYYSKALRVYERVAGQDTLVTAAVRENVANSLGRLQRFDESIPMLEQVLGVRRAKAGEDAAITIRTIANLAWQRMDAGQLGEAQALFEGVLPRYAQAYGEDHPDYASQVSNYGVLLRKKGQIERAEASLRQALTVRLAKLGEDHLATAATRHELGITLLERNRFDDAEPLLKRAYEVRSKQLGADHPQTRASVDALAALNTRRTQSAGAAAIEHKAGS